MVCGCELAAAGSSRMRFVCNAMQMMKLECIIDDSLLDLEKITYSLDRDSLLVMQAGDESFQVFQYVRRHNIMTVRDSTELYRSEWSSGSHQKLIQHNSVSI